MVSWECFTCLTIFLPISTQLEMLRWLRTPLFTVNWVWAMQLKLFKPQSSMALTIFRALSQSTTCTISFIMFHWTNMLSSAHARAALVWEPFLSTQHLKDFLNPLSSGLNILTGLMLELHMSVVKLHISVVNLISITFLLHFCSKVHGYVLLLQWIKWEAKHQWSTLS